MTLSTRNIYTHKIQLDLKIKHSLFTSSIGMIYDSTK